MEQQVQPQIYQRCHADGIGFGTIKKIEVQGGVTMLRVRFDAGMWKWKRLDEVEVIEEREEYP